MIHMNAAQYLAMLNRPSHVVLVTQRSINVSSTGVAVVRETIHVLAVR